jgi:ubiquinone biosynthesis protein UbiJ
MTDTKTTTPTEPGQGEPEGSTLGRLAEKGEEALRRLSGELDKNPRAHEAKDRLSKLQRSTLQQLNIALADEVVELKEEVARLEKRLAKLEKAAAGPPAR